MENAKKFKCDILSNFLTHFELVIDFGEINE